MLNFPATTSFDHRIPKQKFYEHLPVDAELKRLFVEQIELIYWANKLTAQTMNILQGQTVQEIEVFRVRMAGDTLDARVLSIMDRQIPYHLLFVLERPDGLCRLHITYKEANASGATFQLKQTYCTDWQPPEALSLDLAALDMDALYESIVRQIAGDALAAPKEETLKAAIANQQQREAAQKQIKQLEAQMKREKRLAKQMEIRRKIVLLKKATDRNKE